MLKPISKQTGLARFMTTNLDTLNLGKPRFNALELQQIAGQECNLAAWRQAFEQTGRNAPVEVVGDFASALREPDGRTTFLAIDRFAIRTLYHWQIGEQLLFAKRADALADETSEIDPQTIFDHLYTHAIPSPRTLHKGIYRACPANFVLFEQGKSTVAPHWVAEFNKSTDASLESLRDEFRELLEQATAHASNDKAGRG